jgi:hypothetical protein
MTGLGELDPRETVAQLFHDLRGAVVTLPLSGHDHARAGSLLNDCEFGIRALESLQVLARVERRAA